MKKASLFLILLGLALLLAACARNNYICPPPTGEPAAPEALELVALLAPTPGPGARWAARA